MPADASYRLISAGSTPEPLIFREKGEPIISGSPHGTKHRHSDPHSKGIAHGYEETGGKYRPFLSTIAQQL